jgi:hypothetical protein
MRRPRPFPHAANLNKRKPITRCHAANLNKTMITLIQKSFPDIVKSVPSEINKKQCEMLYPLRAILYVKKQHKRLKDVI